MDPLGGAIAMTRFGLGARPGDIAAAAQDPRARLLEELAPGASSAIDDADLRPGSELMADAMRYVAERRRALEEAAASTDGEIARELPEMMRAYIGEVSARTRFAATTAQGFRERLVRFWSNHFTVAVNGILMPSVVGAYEREAIRPHVTGRFVDMLLASATHPAMLFYLDNAYSIGPNSRAGRRSGRGLNENLAREMLELHTLGVHGGYDQADVEELARALTGWTVGNRRFQRENMGAFVFEPRIHEPGARTVLARRYSEGGVDQAEAVIRDLARHPATAAHVAAKLARHFIADVPPESAVAALERRFLDTDGDLGELARTLVSLDAAWAPEQAKMKTTEEFFISALRGLSLPALPPQALAGTYRALGQRPFFAPSPAGWPDDAAAWAGPDLVMKRLEWASAAAGRLPTARPDAFLDAALGALTGDGLRTAVARAASGPQALTLALMSPQFQRR